MGNPDQKPPLEILVAGTDHEEAIHYKLHGEQYIGDRNQVLPLAELDQLILDCMENDRVFMLIFTPVMPTKH
jgi:hypothetical protein